MSQGPQGRMYLSFCRFLLSIPLLRVEHRSIAEEVRATKAEADDCTARRFEPYHRGGFADGAAHLVDGDVLIRHDGDAVPGRSPGGLPRGCAAGESAGSDVLRCERRPSGSNNGRIRSLAGTSLPQRLDECSACKCLSY